MSRLGVNTGSNPNDGQGDPLRIAMGKINSNFTEIYNVIGDGNNLTSYASTAGISTLAQNLTGSPRINVSGILNTGITTTEHIEVRNITSTGVVTATQFVGDGSQLTNVTALVGGLEVLDDNVRKGVARELNFGANIISTGPDGVGRVTISVPSIIGIATIAGYATTSGISTYAQSSGIATYASIAGIATFAQTTGNVAYATSAGIATFAQTTGNVAYATSAGISTVSQLSLGLTGTPNISVNQVGISSSLEVSGVATFYNNVHLDYDKYLLIGDNDELQIFHNGSNSYIDNFSGNNLVIRDNGAGIQLRRYGGGPNAGLMANFNTGGGVELYYDSVIKFQTFQNGVAINESVGIGSTAGNPPYRLTVSGIGATITSGLVNAIADLTSSVNGYGQVNIRNSLSGSNSSGDLVITADNGTDSSNYIDLGINNSTFSNPTWTINGSNDGYLYVSDGNLSIGAASSKYVSIFSGGTLAANERIRVTGIGSVGIGTTQPTAGVDIRSDLRVGINTSQGLIMTDALGNRWRLGVSTTGTLFTTSVS